MMSSTRYTERRSFGPTLESERLPVLGHNRSARRAQVWRRIYIALAGFWLVVLGALIVAVI